MSKNFDKRMEKIDNQTKKFEDRVKEFDLEVIKLQDKYNIKLYAANIVLKNGEVAPMLRLFDNLKI